MLPRTLVSAEDLDVKLGVVPGTSAKTNGVLRRGFVAERENVVDLAVAAVRLALGDAALNANTLDALIFASVMPDQPLPATSFDVLRQLDGASSKTACMDINASCLGFLRGVEIAADAIANGRWQHVVVVAADLASKGLDWTDIKTATLFGDGAGAAVISRSGADHDEPAIAHHTLTLSNGFPMSEIRAGGSRYNQLTPPPDLADYSFRMNGRGLLRLMQEHMPGFIDQCISLADGRVDVVVPHQASATGLQYLRRLLRRRGIRSMIDILPEFGNQVSASLPTALDIAIRSKAVKRGDHVLLIGTSAGVSIGGLVIRY